MKKLIVVSLLLWVSFFVTNCKPKKSSEFDQLRKTESVFVMVVFCEKFQSELQDRQSECKAIESQAEQEIQETLSRWQDLGFAKLIVPQKKGQEIQMALRAKADWSVRYFPLWQSRVILE